MSKTAKQLDKFYTKPSTAATLIDTACSVLSLDAIAQQFIEPSAGGGAFSSQLTNCVAYDLLPEAAGIAQANFLDLDLTDSRDAVIIGNPPFGKKAKLAIAFINHGAKFVDAICFILPNTFRRYNTQAHIDENLALIYDEDLPLDSFTFDGEPYSLKCVFQIWVRKDGRFFTEHTKDLRFTSRPPISHPDFICWQHNATEQSRKYLDEDWKYAFWRQGFKDYKKVFTKADDYDEVKNIMYDTNLQLFLIKPLTDEADKRILSMDLESLASQNLSTPGFGKADFVGEYIRLQEEEN